MELSDTMSQCSRTIKLFSPGINNFKIHYSEQGLMLNNENSEASKLESRNWFKDDLS